MPKTSFLFIWKPLPLNAAQKFKIAFFEIFHPQKHFIMTHPNIGIFEKVLSNPLNYHLLILWNWGVGSKNFFLFFLYTILLYMKKFSNTVNHSNKLMLTYFFCAVFIDLYFKTKHSNETFHLGLYSLSNVFSHRKHISSKSNISVLTISGKSRNIKIIAPSPPFYYQPSHFMVCSQYSLRVILLWLPHFKIFFRNTHPCLFDPPSIQLSTEE